MQKLHADQRHVCLCGVLLTKTLHYLINNVLTAILPGESGSAGCPIHIPCSFPLPRHCTSVHPLGTSPNSSYPPGQSPTESSSDEPSCLLPSSSIVIQLLIQLASPVCPTCQTVSVRRFGESQSDIIATRHDVQRPLVNSDYVQIHSLEFLPSSQARQANSVSY